MSNYSATDPLAGAMGRDDDRDYMAQLEYYSPQVHRFAAQRVANFANAEDIAQQALLLACKQLGTFRGENFRGWLFTIARHLIVDHYRAQHRFEFVDVEDAASREAEPALHTRAEAIHQVCCCREEVHFWVDCISHTNYICQICDVRLAINEQLARLIMVEPLCVS